MSFGGIGDWEFVGQKKPVHSVKARQNGRWPAQPTRRQKAVGGALRGAERQAAGFSGTAHCGKSYQAMNFWSCPLC